MPSLDLLVAAWNYPWPSKEASFLVGGGGGGDGNGDGVVVVVVVFVVVVVVVAYFTPEVSIYAHDKSGDEQTNDFGVNRG